MQTICQIEPDVARLLQEATGWRLIALLFECPGEGWMEQVRELAARSEDATLKTAAEAAARQATPGLYHSAFGPGGPAAAREISHRQDALSGQFLGQLCSVYEAFAYQPAVAEPPDHVAVEAGFIAYLRLKEAYARSRGDIEQADISSRTSGAFIGEHLVRVAEPLSVALSASGINYLASAAQALLQRVGPRPDGLHIPLPLFDEEADCSPLSC